ncbi:MAG: ABC transporter ATP-binding protein [Acidimicrobiia bacterium]
MRIREVGYPLLMNPIVSTSGLTKRYAGGAGVFDLQIEIEEGSIIGLIGPSGSGKTTTVRLLTGLLAPDAGEIVVMGQDPLRFRPEMKGRIGYMAQDSLFYPDLTLRENLNFAASVYGLPYRRSKRLDETLGLVDLSDMGDRLLRNASGGEKRRMALAATLLHQPDLLFLDEPTAGVDPVLRRKFWDHFEMLAGTGVTILVTTQYVGEAAYCDRVGVLADGRILAFEGPDDLRKLAFGGEILHLVFNVRPSRQRLDELEALDWVTDMSWLDQRSLRIVVPDAGAASPRIAEWASSRGLELETADPYAPPFDDVFVEIIEQLDGQAADEDQV